MRRSKSVFIITMVETAKRSFKNEINSKDKGVTKVEYAKYENMLKDKARLINRKLSN